MRSAFTLIELTVVMAVLGAVAIAASSMLGVRTVSSGLDARQEAEVLCTALRTARTTAIGLQVPIRVAIHRDHLGTGYSITSTSDPAQLLQPIQYLPPGVEMEWSTSSIVFFPSGMSDNWLAVTLSHGNARWGLEVRSASGQVTVSKKE